MSATDIVLIIGAVGTMLTGVIAAIGVVLNNRKLDVAATRREQIGTAIIDPRETVLPPKEQS